MEMIYLLLYSYILFFFHHLFQIPDEDLLTRRISQRIDPQTGTIYTEDVYNYIKQDKKVKYFIKIQYYNALISCE